MRQNPAIGIKLSARVEKAIKITGNNAVRILVENPGSCSSVNTLVVINSLRGCAFTLGIKRVKTGPEIKIAGMATRTP